MSETSPIHDLVSALTKLEYQRVTELIRKALSSGTPANEMLKALQEGMINVGKKYEDGEYFLAELMAAGDIFKAATEELAPHLAKSDMASAGAVVLGTVQGDLHDIGKNIFKILLQSGGFTVRDLGVDVSPEQFVNEVKKSDTDILAMSTLLTTTMHQMNLVIERLNKAGLRSKAKIIVGGNPITEEFGKGIGADAAVRDAVLGERICKRWIRGE